MAQLIDGTFNWPNGASIAVRASNSGHFGGATMKRVYMPSDILPATGGKLRILTSYNDIDYGAEIDSEGNVILLPFAAGQRINLPPDLFTLITYVRLETMQSDGVTPQVQAGPRTATVQATR